MRTRAIAPANVLANVLATALFTGLLTGLATHSEAGEAVLVLPSDAAVSPEATSNPAEASGLRVHRLAAIDRGCDGRPDYPPSAAALRVGNGECVLWELVVRNAGQHTLCDVAIEERPPTGAPVPVLSAFIVEQPRPGSGLCGQRSGYFSCTLGNSVAAQDGGTLGGTGTGTGTGTGVYCLRPGETARVRYATTIR